MVGHSWCLRVWGWWVGVGRSWFVLAGLGLVGWWGGVRCKGAPASSYVGLACWRLVGCRWSAMVGPFLAPGYALRCGVGALLPHLGATWAHVEAMLAHLAAMWAHFGAMWAHLGAMLAHLGAMLAHLGAMLAHLGAMLAHLEAYVGPS